MKKIILSLVTISFFVTVVKSQIPNFSFENWTAVGAYSNPDQWGTMNNTSTAVSVYTAEKGTPGNPGSYYLKLTSKTTSLGVLNGIAVSGKLDSTTMKPVSGFAYASRPQKLNGNWQHMIYGTSQGFISALLTKWNTINNKRDTIALAYQTLSGMVMSWAAFSINFTYQSGNNPDSCIIFLSASGATPANLDYLYVDNLNFSGSVAGIENSASAINEFSVSPNPASTQVTINLNLSSKQNTKVEFIDLTGKTLMYKNLGEAYGNVKNSFDVSNLAKGIYFVKVSSSTGISTKKLIIQ